MENRQACSHPLDSAPFVCPGKNRGTLYLIQSVPQRKAMLLTMRLIDALEAPKQSVPVALIIILKYIYKKISVFEAIYSGFFFS